MYLKLSPEILRFKCTVKVWWSMLSKFCCCVFVHQFSFEDRIVRWNLLRLVKFRFNRLFIVWGMMLRWIKFHTLISYNIVVITTMLIMINSLNQYFTYIYCLIFTTIPLFHHLLYWNGIALQLRLDTCIWYRQSSTISLITVKLTIDNILKLYEIPSIGIPG